MSKPRRGNRDLMKAMNRNLILNLLRGQGPLSRSQLHELSGLSVGAVSQITSTLITENWIKEIGEGDYTGGRRQVMLRLNPRAAYVIGLKLMEDRVVCALTDLETNVLYHSEQSLSYDHSPLAVGTALAMLVEQIIAETRHETYGQVLGVGIGLAGVIDYEAGIVHYSPYFHWRDVPLAQMISERIQLPVYMENDVNTLTLTEQLFGIGHEVANFVVVTVGRGVGAGMVLNHQRYQGTRGGAGELGHITLDLNGPRCDCGKTGCLEAFASDKAVFRYIERMGGAAEIGKTLSLPAVTESARHGNRLAQDALAQAGRYLGLGLAMIVNILCPSLIVVSGEGISAGEYRIQPMLRTMRENTFNGLLDHVQVIVKPTDDQMWARGAAGLVIGRVFESPLIPTLQTV